MLRDIYPYGNRLPGYGNYWEANNRPRTLARNLARNPFNINYQPYRDPYNNRNILGANNDLLRAPPAAPYYRQLGGPPAPLSPVPRPRQAQILVQNNNEPAQNPRVRRNSTNRGRSDKELKKMINPRVDPPNYYVGVVDNRAPRPKWDQQVQKELTKDGTITPEFRKYVRANLELEYAHFKPQLTKEKRAERALIFERQFFDETFGILNYLDKYCASVTAYVNSLIKWQM